MLLDKALTYIGRTEPVGCDGGYFYYVLVYAGAEPEGGGHRVTVETRLACTGDASFYGFATSASATLGDRTVYSWNRRLIPGEYWGSSDPLTEDGVRYPRWTTLARRELVTEDTAAGGEYPLSVRWVMESALDRSWFPYTGVPAEGVFPVELPGSRAAVEGKLSSLRISADGQTRLFLTLENTQPGANCRVDWLFGQEVLESFPQVTGSMEYIPDPGLWLPKIPEAANTLELPEEEAPRVRVTALDPAGEALPGGWESRFDILVPQSFGPEIGAFTLSPTGLLQPPFDTQYIQRLTAVKAAFTAWGRYGAQIRKAAVVLEGEAFDQERNWISRNITGSGKIPVRLLVTDSRGLISDRMVEITVLPYDSPLLELTRGERTNGNGIPTDGGSYLALSVRGSCSSIAGAENRCLLELRWKTDRGEYNQWQPLTGEDTQVEYQGFLEQVVADPQSSYRLQLRCRDSIGGWTVTEFTAAPEEIYMHRTANALGLGKYVEQPRLLDCAWDVRLRGKLLLGDQGQTLEEYITEILERMR